LLFDDEPSSGGRAASLTELERRYDRARAAYDQLKKKLDHARWREEQPFTQPLYIRAEWRDLEAREGALYREYEAALSGFTNGRTSAIEVLMRQI
jgi:hypothetical protein